MATAKSLGAIGAGALEHVNSVGISTVQATSLSGAKAAAAPTAQSANLGFSTGGAKDVDNFRENIRNGYLPLPTDVTYEGLFYDYYFDTGQKEECTRLFCPSYSYAITKDPFSGKDEYYLSVGLNSGMKESDFQRKKLNLVVVLDTSGSMNDSFEEYYYDAKAGTGRAESKMSVAASALVALLNHLNPDDRFGVVLFDEAAQVAKPMGPVDATAMDAFKSYILGIRAHGLTNMEAGMREGMGQFNGLLPADQSEYENRIIFITDAMPNLGAMRENEFIGMAEQYAANGVYTTFIGVGVDFNTALVEYIAGVRGANYYSVHSPADFRTRMDDEFDYMVTPLIFNLVLELDSQGYEIEKVYGSPQADETTGELMRVNTLFPSKKEDWETKGGLVLLKLRKVSPQPTLRLRASYETRLGDEDGSEVTFDLEERASSSVGGRGGSVERLPTYVTEGTDNSDATVNLEGTPDYFENNGIRKGILLVRYASLLKNWMIDERTGSRAVPLVPSINEKEGIVIPPETTQLGEWERQSVPLRVSEEYGRLFAGFKGYFEREMGEIDDGTLSQEIEVLEKLSARTLRIV